MIVEHFSPVRMDECTLCLSRHRFVCMSSVPVVIVSKIAYTMNRTRMTHCFVCTSRSAKMKNQITIRPVDLFCPIHINLVCLQNKMDKTGRSLTAQLTIVVLHTRFRRIDEFLDCIRTEQTPLENYNGPEDALYHKSNQSTRIDCEAA